MRAYREISVAGEGRGGRVSPSRPAVGAGLSHRWAGWRADWRSVLGTAGRGVLEIGLRRPGGTLGGAVALGAAVLVCVNALGSQTGRHPAPILPKVAPRTEAPAPRAVERSGAEAPREVASRAGDRGADRGADTRPPGGAGAGKAPVGDPIGDLIQETTASVGPKSERAVPERAAPVGPKPGPAVLQAQRALVKLGYGPLKPDGVMGSGTRTAIERFERDRKLPVKGEPAGRTLRELAARAGLPPG